MKEINFIYLIPDCCSDSKYIYRCVSCGNTRGTQNLLYHLLARRDRKRAFGCVYDILSVLYMWCLKVSHVREECRVTRREQRQKRLQRQERVRGSTMLFLWC